MKPCAVNESLYADLLDESIRVLASYPPSSAPVVADRGILTLRCGVCGSLICAATPVAWSQLPSVVNS